MAGGATGKLLPTGNLRDVINGIEVTCMDVAMPVVMARAKAFGLTGYKTREQLDANSVLRPHGSGASEGCRGHGHGRRLEIRHPKFAVVAAPRDGGSFATRYFMPWQTHPTLAVTGGQCMATCGLTPGTVADGIWNRTNASPAALQIEHPTGKLDISVEFENRADGFDVISSGL